MNVFRLRVCIIIIFIRITMFRVTYLWYGIYRKSGRRDGQTNNFFFFILVMDQKTCLQLGPPLHDVYKVPIHTCAEEWEVVGRQLCAFCARWILFKFITVVSHAPLLNYFEQRPDDNVIKHYYNNNENYITLEKLLGRHRCW